VQLAATGRPASIRSRLSAAACVLLAAGAPSMARGDPRATTQLDATALLYGEENRANVVEPTVRITRLLPDGQSLSAQLGLDVITGASPTGAMPSGVPQTITSPSGTVTTRPAGQIPVTNFTDARVALDGEWRKPLGLLASTLGGHVSREKDYQSLGARGKLSLDLMHRLTTVTVGGGFNHDRVFPVTASSSAGSSEDDESAAAPATALAAASAAAASVTGSHPKRVTTTMVGLSRVITRRWMMSVSASRTLERGELTEPYKVVSLLDSITGLPAAEVPESRPSSRERADVLGSSVYQLGGDVLYLSYRRYWDDWSVQSHTFDVKYRHELGSGTFVEPHLRYYRQTPASFFRFGLVQGTPLPPFATSDYRLGPLRTVTVGGTYGFRIPDAPGEWTVRAEYIGQFGNGHPKDGIGALRQFDLFPTVNIGTLVVGYSVAF
jgi:hypothetical protein